MSSDVKVQPTASNVATNVSRPQGPASTAQFSAEPTKAPFPTSTSTPQSGAQNAAANTARPVLNQATQAAAAGSQVAFSSSNKTSIGPQSPASAPAPSPTAGAGTTLAGAVSGFQQKDQGGGGSGGQGQSEQQRQALTQAPQQVQAVQRQASPYSSMPTVANLVEVSGITQISPIPKTDPAPARSFTEKIQSFLSDFSLFKGSMAGNDPTAVKSDLHFPAQWLAGKATPLVPPVAFAAGVTESIAEVVKPSNDLAAYDKRSKFFHTHAAAKALAPERHVMPDWDAQQYGAIAGATHSAFDRMPLRVYQIYDQQEEQAVT